MDKILENSSSELPNEIKLSNDNDSNPIFDIISTLQSKLNTINTGNAMNSNSKNVTDTNDAINKEQKGQSGFDISKLNTVLNNLSQNNDNTNSNNPSSSANILSDLADLNLDVSTIMKVQKIFSKLNKDDPRKNLLVSLKPFLRETRQKNLDTYMILISLADAFDIFGKKETGGE